jgi:23S rRNA (uracil1939-C5)-methyltransferase
MAMALRKFDEVTVQIQRLAYGGRGVGRVDGFVVFVPDTAPGDVARVRLLKVKRSYGEGQVVAIESPSPLRTTPPCPYFGPCGGCTWQHVPYEIQTQVKESIVRESLEHIGGLKDLPILPILPAPDPWGYRNKMEFTFHQDGSIGLHMRGAFDRIVDVDRCLIQSPLMNAILHEVREFVRERKLPGYDPHVHTGFLRHLVIREGRQTGEALVLLVTSPGEFPQARELAGDLIARHPEIKGVLRGINPSVADAVQLAQVEVLAGRPFIYERITGLTFKIRPDTFFQTNTAQAERLVEVVTTLSELQGRETVVDLYCGVGTFSLALARNAGQVFGVEINPAAVEAARENARLNEIENVEFLAGDARTGLVAIASKGGHPDVLVLDPPRSGAGRRVVRVIAMAGPRRVVYVSCNPTTLASDLKLLVPMGYTVRAVQPIDLFPQTYHVECVVALDRAR